MSEAQMACLMLGNLPEFILLTAALSWTYTKEIYYFDATLLTELLAKPLAHNFSIDGLMQLPEPCTYIEAPIAIGDQMALGFFVWMEYDTSSVKRKAIDLLLVFHMTDGSAVSRIFHLSDMPEQDIAPLSELTRPNEITMDEKAVAQGVEPLPEDLRTVIQLVLYLCAEESDIFDTNHPNLPDGSAAGEAETANIWKVGFRIGNAIRKYSNLTLEEQHIYERDGHAGFCPYMRRAHWHSYWLGTRKNKTRRLVIWWMPSVLVGATWKQEPTTVVWRGPA